MRRAGEFSRVIAEYESVTFERDDLNQAISFQIGNAHEKDDGCYTFRDVEMNNLA